MADLKIKTPGGHFITIEPLLFERAAIKVTRAKAMAKIRTNDGTCSEVWDIAEEDFDRGFADEVYEFPSWEAAWAAIHDWDGEGEPDGWDRAKVGGEPEWRRRPDGDASREFRRA